MKKTPCRVSFFVLTVNVTRTATTIVSTKSSTITRLSVRKANFKGFIVSYVLIRNYFLVSFLSSIAKKV